MAHAPAPSLAVLLERPVAQLTPAPMSRPPGAGKAMPVVEKLAPWRPRSRPGVRVAPPRAALPTVTAGSLPPAARLPGPFALVADLEQLRTGHPLDAPQLLWPRDRPGEDWRRPSPVTDDKNVNPQELADFARAGSHRSGRVNGDTAFLKRLLVAGIPVLIETWYEPKPNDGMGHYRLLVGYDDAAVSGSPTTRMNRDGVPRNQPYTGITYRTIPLTISGRSSTAPTSSSTTKRGRPAVEAILGDDLDDAFMARRSLDRAKTAVDAAPDDPFAWFNLGSNYVALGDYAEAASAYDKARRLRLPWRMLWYQFGPFRAYYEVGRYAEVVSLADVTLRTAKNVEELHFWRGLALHALGDTAGARAAWQRALAVNYTHADSKAALAATAAP